MSGKPAKPARVKPDRDEDEEPDRSAKDAQRTIAHGSGNAREEAKNNKEQGRERIE